MKSLDHAEHDRADKGHGEVRGDYAQSPGECHEVAPSMRAALRAGSWLTESLLSKKSALLSLISAATAPPRPVWLKNTEINVLKSL
jgi:hypothetical protein